MRLAVFVYSPLTVHYEKLFKACQSKYQGEGPTGVLLVYPQHCVHLMEAPWEIVVDVVANLHVMNTSGYVQHYGPFVLSIMAHCFLI